MKKTKSLMLILFIGIILFLIPNISNAAVDVTRQYVTNDGSVRFNFTGLTLDKTHEYEFGLTKTSGVEVGTWHLIADYTETTAILDVKSNASDLRNILNTTDIGYITIKDKTSDTIVLQSYNVDLKTPYLRLTNYTIIPNGKSFSPDSENIKIGLRNANNSKAYYQYEKITDEAIVNKYKELKKSNDDIMKMENMLKTTTPTSNWNEWGYWNGHNIIGIDGFGYTQRNISVPDTGLYYMWVYFSGNNLKDVYGYILVDNLQPEIALEGISISKTQTIELGKTLTLKPTFNPTNATNKILTWSSSDESVATVDNAGKITPKKVGSTIITVVSQDGNKRATCTVTVTEATSQKPGTNNSNNGQPSNNGDNTVAPGKLPQTGLGIGIISAIIVVIAVSIIVYKKCNKYRDI